MVEDMKNVIDVARSLGINMWFNPFNMCYSYKIDNCTFFGFLSQEACCLSFLEENAKVVIRSIVDCTPKEQHVYTSDEKCVHTRHCCAKCGCKYDDENCPVWLGYKRQEYDHSSFGVEITCKKDEYICTEVFEERRENARKPLTSPEDVL